MASALAALGCVALAACGPDPNSVEGALARAASAVASRDHAALFEALDERSRFALGSVYHARQQAARVIRESYPAEARVEALRELGDAAEATSIVDLFEKRCDAGCVDGFAAVLGAPRAVRIEGDESVVETVRGTETRLYRSQDGRYGLVWQTASLVRERSRAAAELDLIEKNGQAYRAQRALDTK